MSGGKGIDPLPPRVLNQRRITAILAAAQVGLDQWGDQIHAALKHDISMAGMHDARELDKQRASAMEAFIILTARYVDSTEVPDNPDVPLITDTPLDGI